MRATQPSCLRSPNRRDKLTCHGQKAHSSCDRLACLLQLVVQPLEEVVAVVAVAFVVLCFSVRGSVAVTVRC